MSHCEDYLEETRRVAGELSAGTVELLAEELADLRNAEGRLWIIGLGGSAANASHAANDFRKLCHIDAQVPTDNVSEFSARANDGGLESAFYLPFAQPEDALLVLSVGGGTATVSAAIVNSINDAKNIGMKIFGIVGRDGGWTAKAADVCIVVPTVNDKHVTPHTEAFHMVVLHCLVSHPLLQVNKTKW